MATLHLLSHSPFADSRLASCLHLVNADDALLLCGDAVYALKDGTAQRKALDLMPESIALFALDEDVAARGINSLPSRLQQIDYDGFVELCCHYDRTNSWL